MNEFLENSLFAGVTISLLAYMAGAFLKKKFKIALLNPLFNIHYFYQLLYY